MNVLPAAVSGLGMFAAFVGAAVGVADADGLFSPSCAAANSSSVGFDAKTVS